MSLKFSLAFIWQIFDFEKLIRDLIPFFFFLIDKKKDKIRDLIPEFMEHTFH